MNLIDVQFSGGVYSIFGFNREKLECDDDKLNYCRYSYPNQLLRDIGIQDCAKNNSTTSCDQFMYENQKTDFIQVIGCLILFALLFRTIAYFIMSHRLKN